MWSRSHCSWGCWLVGKQGQDPLLLKALMLVHNIFLIGLSLYMCVKILYEAVVNNHNPRKRAQSPLNRAVRNSAVVKRSGKDRPELIFSLFSSLRYTFWGNAYDPAQTEVRLQTVVPLRKTFANFCSAKVCAGLTYLFLSTYAGVLRWHRWRRSSGFSTSLRSTSSWTR
eukprot:4049437-Pyramimonas_sp.AAC.1